MADRSGSPPPGAAERGGGRGGRSPPRARRGHRWRGSRRAPRSTASPAHARTARVTSLTSAVKAAGVEAASMDSRTPSSTPRPAPCRAATTWVRKRVRSLSPSSSESHATRVGLDDRVKVAEPVAEQGGLAEAGRCGQTVSRWLASRVRVELLEQVAGAQPTAGAASARTAWWRAPESTPSDHRRLADFDEAKEEEMAARRALIIANEADVALSAEGGARS